MHKPSHPEQARELMRAGQQQQAESLLRMQSGDEACQAALRDLLLSEGRRDEAFAVAARMAGEDSPEQLVSKALIAFRDGNLPASLQACQAALALQADCASAHHHAGRALHNAGQAGPALDALGKAVRLRPDYAEAWLSLGHAQRAGGDFAAALQSFRKALELAPALEPARLDLGITLFHQEQTEAALAEFNSLLQSNPEHVEALVNAGLSQLLLGQLEPAWKSLRAAIDLDADNPLAWLYLGQLHNELTDTEQALSCLRRATALDPMDVEAWIELTCVLEQANREDEAIEALRRGFAADPTHPGLHLEGAKLERRRGDTAAALRRLRGLDPAQLPRRVALQYGFELGLALDREGEADAAIEAFTLGNRLARQGASALRTDPDALERRCAALDAWLDAGAPGIEPGPGEGPDGEDLCFLVGFPRSGTTLVDTTLATNPQVLALEEAATLDPLIRRLEQADPPYPAGLARFTAEDVAAGRQSYRMHVNQLLNGASGALTIDKMPLRFMHAGLIQRLFPEARIVFIARHPGDVVLSNFMQHYTVNETNIHFDTLAHSAQTYARIMGLWAKLEDRLALPVLTVRYEDLVEDIAGAMAPVCTFLDIEPASLSFEREARLGTRDRVRTSSYQQVAEPIYRRASGRWQRYRRHLEPLLPLLEPAMQRYRYQD